MTDVQLELKQNVLRIQGSVCFSNVVSLLHEGKFLMKDLDKITVNLEGLAPSDSSAFALFAAWLRIAQKENKAIIFTHAPLFIRNVARVYGLESVLPISWEN